VVCGSANHLFVLLHKICRATNPERAAVEHMGVDHGGFHVLVAQQLLNGADVLATLQLRIASPPFAPRSDRDDGGPGYRIPCHAIASAGGTPTATPTPDWRLGTSGLLKKPNRLQRSLFQPSKSDKLATNRTIDDCCNC
jgi:hypothetical protein